MAFHSANNALTLQAKSLLQTKTKQCVLIAPKHAAHTVPQMVSGRKDINQRQAETYQLPLDTIQEKSLCMTCLVTKTKWERMPSAEWQHLSDKFMISGSSVNRVASARGWRWEFYSSFGFDLMYFSCLIFFIVGQGFFLCVLEI